MDEGVDADGEVAIGDDADDVLLLPLLLLSPLPLPLLLLTLALAPLSGGGWCELPLASHLGYE